MRKQLTLLACILSSVTFIAAAVPQITVDSDAYEFGSVLDGTPVRHTFVLTNVGDRSLIITGVRSSAKCPCTIHELGTDTLKPGESTELVVTWDTRGYGGRGYPGMSFYIDSNDPTTPRLLVSLVGEVLALGPHHTSVDEVHFTAYVLVDLRASEAYDQEHIMGAINIPYESLDNYIGLLSCEHLIIFYDEDDSRSLSAVEKMLEGGYREYYVVNLHGGLPAWRAIRGATWPSNPLVSASGVAEDTVTTQPSGSHTVTVQQLQRWFFALIDVRPPREYDEGHLVGAINIPFEQLDEYLDLVPSNDLLVVYDEDGMRSDQAVEVMVNHGITRAQSLIVGISLWFDVFGKTLIWPPQSLSDRAPQNQ